MVGLRPIRPAGEANSRVEIELPNLKITIEQRRGRLPDPL